MNPQDEYTIDKARVRASFDRAATSYDAAAVLQKEVRVRMLERLDYTKIAPARILDAVPGRERGRGAADEIRRRELIGEPARARARP